MHEYNAWCVGACTLFLYACFFGGGGALANKISKYILITTFTFTPVFCEQLHNSVLSFG